MLITAGVCDDTVNNTIRGKSNLEIELGKMEPAPMCGGYRLTVQSSSYDAPHSSSTIITNEFLIFQNIFMGLQSSGCRDEGYFLLELLRYKPEPVIILLLS